MIFFFRYVCVCVWGGGGGGGERGSCIIQKQSLELIICVLDSLKELGFVRHFTLSQMTNSRLFQTESFQMTILNLMKIAESSPKG